MALNFTIRLGGLNDATEIAKVNVASWKESYVGIVDKAFLKKLKPEHRLESFQRLAMKTEVYCFVAEVAGNVVGFCHAGLASGPFDGILGEVWTLYVLEPYKNQGIGFALWAQATEYLRKKAFVPFQVWTLADNLQARAFYERQGGVFNKSSTLKMGKRIYDEVRYEFK